MHEISPAQALVIRAGWGEGEQVADGRWLHARALGSPETWGSGGPREARGEARVAIARGRCVPRSASRRCSARAARRCCARSSRCARATISITSASSTPHSSSTARTRSRSRELQAEGRQDLAIRIAELEQLRPGVQAQAQAALLGAGADVGAAPGADAADTRVATPEKALDEDALAHALERLEAALRARTAAGI